MLQDFQVAILRHDGKHSIVAVSGEGENGKVWVTFGEVTAEGFNPCYATIQVDPVDIVSRYSVKGNLGA